MPCPMANTFTPTWINKNTKILRENVKKNQLNKGWIGLRYINKHKLYSYKAKIWYKMHKRKSFMHTCRKKVSLGLSVLLRVKSK